MEMSASGTKARGAVGRETFEAVQQLVGEGKKRTEAFAIVAERTGRSPGTVATAYYRVARTVPGAGGVKLRPRKGRRPSASRRAPRARATTDMLVRDLLDAANALARHVRTLEGELADARAASEQVARVRAALDEK
jgi:hypothetical protein